MDKNSYLNPRTLSAKCDEAIIHLTTDRGDLNTMRNKLQSIAGDTELKGEAAKAAKDNLKDYFLVISLSDSADSNDINELKTAKNILSNEDIYDGALICECYDRAKKRYLEYEVKAGLARAAELAYTPVWYFQKGVGWIQSTDPNPYTALVQQYSAIAEAEKTLRDYFQGKKDSFDGIEANTCGMLNDGMEIRGVVSQMLSAMEEQKNSKTYVPGSVSVYLQQLISSKSSFCRSVSAGIIASDEYDDLLLDPKFQNDPDVVELEQINKDIDNLEQMILSTDNTTASEEMKKALNGLIEKKKDTMASVLKKTNHGEYYDICFNYLRECDYSDSELEELMWQWLKIDRFDITADILFPDSWMEGMENDFALLNEGILYDGDRESIKDAHTRIMERYHVITIVVGLGDNDFQKAYNRAVVTKIVQNHDFERTFSTAHYDSLFAVQLLQEIRLKKGDVWNGLVAAGELVSDVLTEPDIVKKAVTNCVYDLAARGVGLDYTVFNWLNNLSNGKCSYIQGKVDEYEEYLDVLLDWKEDYDWINFGQNDLLSRAKDLLRRLPDEKVNDLYTLLVEIPVFFSMTHDQIEDHFSHNTQGWKNYLKDKSSYMNNMPYDDGKFYIEHQYTLGDYLYYGVSVLGLGEEFLGEDGLENGNIRGNENLCEVISAYNVLTFFGDENADFAEIIKDFEMRHPALGGTFGSAPEVVKDFMIDRGYDVSVIDTGSLSHDPNGPDDFDALLEEYDAFILSDWNGLTTEEMMHTMAITVQKDIDPATGDTLYTIVRHNDGGPDDGCTICTDSEGLYELLCEYTCSYDENHNITGTYNDGSLQIIGVKNE